MNVPRTLDAAIDALAGGGAAVLAGGTDLVLMRQSGQAVGRLVDVKRVETMRGVARGDGEVRIGACTTLDVLDRGDVLAANAVSDGAALVGGWQTRTRATIGGNVCRASPSADTLCGLLVCGAELELASTAGVRRVPLGAFLTGPGTTDLAPGELLTQIVLPAEPGGSAYVRYTPRRAMDLAVACVAARISLDGRVCVDAAIALGACAPTPLLVPDAARCLVGTTVDDAAVAAAAACVIAAARPIDDVRASATQRLRVLPSLTRRAIRIACARALRETAA
jgi:carbon-monoxide dehydrogenase medium subunit